MAVYTCIEMIRDCRTGKAEGWQYFVRTFAPALLAMVRHYSGRDAPEHLRTVLAGLPVQGPAVFTVDALVGERDLMASMRPAVLAATAWGSAPPEIELELDTLAEALEPLTVVERQLVWLDAMGYEPAEAAVIMRVSAQTAEKVREKAAELLRAKLDGWNQSIVRGNGAALQQEAASRKPEHPVGARDCFDILDGRITWQQRTNTERQLAASWYEIDHFCRLREADHMLRTAAPLADLEAEEALSILGVVKRKPPMWKRLFG